MPTVFEPIGAGIAVALINKFIINNNCLWNYISNCNAVPVDLYDDGLSSTSTSTIDTEFIHAHFTM